MLESTRTLAFDEEQLSSSFEAGSVSSPHPWRRRRWLETVQLTRTGGLRTLNATLMAHGMLGGVGGSDIIAVSSGSTITAGTTAVTSLPCSAALTKQIPAGCTILTIPAAGTMAGVQAWNVPSLTAAA